MSHEKWLITGLSLTIVTLLLLTIALTYNLGWDRLQIATLIFFLSYPLIWLAWRSYQFWRSSIMQLTMYTQVLHEGELNLRFKKQHKNNLLLELQKEIYRLALSDSDKQQKEQTLESLISSISRSLVYSRVLI